MLRPVKLVLSAFLIVAFVVTVGTRSWRSEQPLTTATTIAAADVQISRQQFAQYIREWSEPEGYFDSDNFISNETSYLHVIDRLRSTVPEGGVYLGVGPDQNFSYIAHTRPSLAIIVDIRRQNMLQHLLYKALFETSATRAEFLAKLFSRAVPPVEPDLELPDLLTAIRGAESSEERYQANLAELKKVIADYGLELSADDLSKIEYVYKTFHEEALDLRFSSLGRGNSLQYPTLESLLTAVDRLDRHQNYLATEELFQWMKKFQAENRLIPIVGDFAGSHAFKAVAEFLKASQMAVHTFYTSNVEFYLFGRPAWSAYMDNVRQLPAASNSVFIRAYFSTYGRRHPENVPGHRSTTLVHHLPSFVADYNAERIPTYWEVVNR